MYRKVAKVYLLPICAVSRREPISIIFGADLTDIINCAKFHVDRLSGFRFEGCLKIACSCRKTKSSLS
jgi:hypothetical protein